MIAAGATLEASADSATKSSSRAILLQGFGVAAALCLLGLTLRQVDLARVSTVIGHIGPRGLLLLVPSFCAIALETHAWQRAFSMLGTRHSFWSLFGVRVESESLGLTLPLGAVFADAIKPRLLARRCGTTTPVALVGTAARKYLLVLAQAGYLVIGFALGHALLERAFERAFGWGALANVALFGAAFLVGLAEGTAFALRGGAAFKALLGALARFKWKPLQTRMEGWNEQLRHSDATAVRFFGASGVSRFAIAVPCLGAWLLEATETWAILHVLGSNLSWGDAVAIEAVVVFVRNVLAFLPGGLGAQELGYATLLSGAGADPTTSAALMLLKRSRELLWVVAGGTMLAAAALQTRPSRTPAVAADLA